MKCKDYVCSVLMWTVGASGKEHCKNLTDMFNLVPWATYWNQQGLYKYSWMRVFIESVAIGLDRGKQGYMRLLRREM